jgi:hypothetical protein
LSRFGTTTTEWCSGRWCNPMRLFLYYKSASDYKHTLAPYYYSPHTQTHTLRIHHRVETIRRWFVRICAWPYNPGWASKRNLTHSIRLAPWPLLNVVRVEFENKPPPMHPPRSLKITISKKPVYDSECENTHRLLPQQSPLLSSSSLMMLDWMTGSMCEAECVASGATAFDHYYSDWIRIFVLLRFGKSSRAMSLARRSVRPWY